MSYYYNLRNNKKLEYNAKGQFYCPEVFEAKKIEEAKRKHYFVDKMKHDDVLSTGQWHVERDQEIKTEMSNGDVEIRGRRLHKKVASERKDLFCRCGKPMVFVGYKVWIEKCLTKDKPMGIFTVKGNTKRLLTRYFKKKKAQTEFIRKTVKEMA